jgi:hypothetical protein
MMRLNVAETDWRKSSYSGGLENNCLEVMDLPEIVPVRDSKAPDGPILIFGSMNWSEFVGAVKNGLL